MDVFSSPVLIEMDVIVRLVCCQRASAMFSIYSASLTL